MPFSAWSSSERKALGQLMLLVAVVIVISFAFFNRTGIAKAGGGLTGESVGLNIAKPVYRPKAGTLTFKFTVINDGDTAQRKVIVHFTPNIRPWGLVDGHLTWDTGGRNLRWPVGTLRAGESRTLYIPVQVPQKVSTWKICAGASMQSASFKPFWAKSACFYQH